MRLAASFLYAKKIILSSFVAKTENRTSRRSFFGAAVCIAISLVPLITIISVENGMIDGMTKRIVWLSSQDIRVEYRAEQFPGNDSSLFAECTGRLSAIPHVTGFVPEVSADVLACAGGYRTGALVRGVETDVFSAHEGFSSMFTLCAGSLDFSRKRSCVIGKKMSELLGVGPGEKIQLISSRLAGKSIVPKVSVFTVAGVVSSGYQELDAMWIFVSVADCMESLANSSSRYFVGITTDVTFSDGLEDVQDAVEDSLFSMDESLCPRFVFNWKDLNRDKFENFASTKILLIVVMVFIILVACINVSSAILMIILERRSEIAVLKSLGASSSEISLSFMAVGCACGAAGLLLGISAGIIISLNVNPIISAFERILNFFSRLIYLAGSRNVSWQETRFLDPSFYLQDIEVSVPVGELVLVSAVTLVLSFVMSVLPSVRAGRERPLELFRKN